MNIIEKMRTQRKEALKAKNDMASFINYVIAKIDGVGKSNGNRETTEDEALRVIKKLVDETEQMIKTSPNANRELAFLKQFMPDMANPEELEKFILDEIENGANHIGKLMGAVKAKFGETADMKLASQLAKKHLT